MQRCDEKEEMLEEGEGKHKKKEMMKKFVIIERNKNLKIKKKLK